MRTRLIAVVLLTLSIAGRARATESAPRPSWTWTRTRPLSGASTLLDRAVEGSSIVASLLEQIEETDLVVYVTDSMPQEVGGATSYLLFLSCEEGSRYLMIRLDRFRLTPRERIKWLGHELQHALEVAAAPQVRDAAGMAQLYQRIGWEGGSNRVESQAATTTGNRVWQELSRGRLWPAPPPLTAGSLRGGHRMSYDDGVSSSRE